MKFFLCLLLVVSTASATTLHLADSKEWKAGQEEQRAAFKAKFGNGVRDVAIAEEFAVTAALIEMPIPAQENADGLEQLRVNARGGVVHGASRAGYQVIDQGEVEFGPLPGFYVIASRREAEAASTMMIIGGCAADKIYCATFYPTAEAAVLSPSSPYVRSYLSRVSFSDVKQAPRSGVDPESAAFKIGYFAGYFLFPILLVVGSAVVLYLLMRKRTEPTESGPNGA